MSARAAELARRVRVIHERIIAGGETDLAGDYIHRDFVNHQAVPERRHGPDGFAATSDWLRSCFGAISFEFHHVLVDGDLAAAHLTMRGTHEGGIPPGLPATHRPFAQRHVHLIRFAADGLALEHWAVRDDLGALRQINQPAEETSHGPHS